MFSPLTCLSWAGHSPRSFNVHSKSVRSTNGTRSMATLKELKLRLKTVTSIAKLTKTMQMVASSKLKVAQRNNEQAKPYARPVKKFLEEVNLGVNREKGNNLFIILTSDKGMCGPVNTQLVRYMKHKLKEEPIPHSNFAMLGTKGTTAIQYAFPGQVYMTAKDFGKKEFSFLEVCLLVETLLQKEKSFDSVTVVFNHYKNALTYPVTEFDIPGEKTMAENKGKFMRYFGLDRLTMRDFFEYQIAVAIWGGILDSKASELAARTSSMDNATKNAKAIIAQLQLSYNRGRQAAITTELIEITSGASVQQDAE